MEAREPPPSGAGEIRRAGADDVPALAAALARAFIDDPVALWLFPDRGRRAELLPRMYADLALLGEGLPHGEVCCLVDCSGAAIWHPPARVRPGVVETMRLLPAALRIWGRDLPRVARGFGGLQSHRPAEPHLYLALLGVAPEAQGGGLGSALMRPVLERCDRDRIPAYLEASTPRSRALYERHGFAVTGEYRFPGDGPVEWLMWREPGANPVLA